MDFHPYDIVHHDTTHHDNLCKTYDMPHMLGLGHATWNLCNIKVMPHGIYVGFRTCHMAPSLGYDMPHGTYVRPCHVAFMQGIGHATYTRLRP
jgi:hypothetical protein